jgi:autotransporter-associated beta strand protein
MHTIRRRHRSAQPILLAAAAAVFGMRSSVASAQITETTISSSDWRITNGSLTVDFNPGNANITSVKVGVSSPGPNILDTYDAGESKLYPEFAGTPFGSGPSTSGFNQTSTYIDFWQTVSSTGTTVNPITYSFHYIMYLNDPAIHTYEVLNHSASDPATSVGQGQFLMRVDPRQLSTLYQVDTSPNNLDVQTTTLPSTPAQLAELNGTNGYGNATRLDIAEVLDLNGAPDLQSLIGRPFLNKYDYSSYEQFHQAQLEYGSTVSVANVVTSQDTMTGGPTKQNLQFTNNILMTEFLSNHYGDNAAPYDYSYVPTQGVNTSRLFGPYTFRVTPTNGETGAQLYADAVNSAATYPSLFNTDTTLIANGYIPTTARGTFAATFANTAGWSADTNNNTTVLADPNTNFQMSQQGYQYWTQIGTTGAAQINSVAPGTYRLSTYEYGQWGETRVDGVKITSHTTTTPNNTTFVPENFGTAAPIWTIGTPDRSANEFLNGSVTAAEATSATGPVGADIRDYWGNYNYWQQEANLGNNGKVVYYATPVGSIPATNNTNDWISNQWQVFNPTLYNPANNTNTLYSTLAPAYVNSGGGPANYKGLPWEVHFTTTAAQKAQGQYVVLSVALAASESDLTVALNGNSETWTIPSTMVSDPNNRSGQSGLYQWAAFQFPIADLGPNGTNNAFTFTVDKSGGVMYDALRMEITNTSAAPSSTGWYDYNFISSAGMISQNDQIGLPAEDSVWAVNGTGAWGTALDWVNSFIPQTTRYSADFTSAIDHPSFVVLNSNFTVGSLYFKNSNSYTINPGLGGSIILDNAPTSTAITDDLGSHTVNVPVVLNQSALVKITNATDTFTMSAPISGAGGITLTGAGTLALNAINSYSGATNVTSGLLLLGSRGAVPVNSPLTIGTNLTTGTVRLANNTHTTTFTSLTINSGSTLDITNNTVAINFTSPATDPVVTIAANLTSAYSTGLWTGAGITSTTAATNPSALAVGYADGNIDTGTPAAPNQILIKYTLAGDANLDGLVNFTDLVAVVQNFNKPGTDWAQGNFGYGASTNFNDLVAVVQNFNQILTPAGSSGDQLGGTPIQIQSLDVQLPEPGAAGLLILSAAILKRRRNR